MTASSIQAWVAIVGTLLTAAAGLLQYFSYRSRRDRLAAVGAAFSATVESLTSDSEIQRIAAAVLLRRFMRRGTEQAGAGGPYRLEAVEVTAGVLRQVPAGQFQKALADGLRYAGSLVGADLQRCNLKDAYLGRRTGDRSVLDLSDADFYGADCTGASFRDVVAVGAAFYEAVLDGAVFAGADLRRADFRMARLSGVNFSGARIGGARFQGATDVPDEVSDLLGNGLVANDGAEVGRRAVVR